MADPSTISGLYARFRADSITGIADGAQAGSWPDTSGNGNTAGNDGRGYGASGIPRFVASSLNGRPAVRFVKASKQFVASGASTGAPQQTIVAVLIPVAGVGGTIRGAGGTAGLQLAYGTDLKPYNVSQYDLGLGTSTIALKPGAGNVVISTFDSNVGSTWRVNGAAAGTSSTKRALSAQSFWIGENGSAIAGGGSEAISADILEVLAWNRILSTAEQAIVDSYVQDRYGVAVADYLSDSKQVSYTGAGTLATAAGAGVTAPAAYSGTGTLADTAQPTVTRAAGYGGTGNLTASALLATVGAATYSGGGALEAAARPMLAATAGYAGMGSLALLGRPLASGAASYAGAGALAVATSVHIDRTHLGALRVRAAWWGSQRVRRIGYGSRLVVV